MDVSALPSEANRGHQSAGGRVVVSWSRCEREQLVWVLQTESRSSARGYVFLTTEPFCCGRRMIKTKQKNSVGYNSLCRPGSP